MSRFVLIHPASGIRIRSWDFTEGDYRAMDSASIEAIEMCNRYGRGYEIWCFVDGVREENTTYKGEVAPELERIPR